MTAEVKYNGIERGNYDEVKAVLFVHIPIPGGTDLFYEWTGGFVSSFTDAKRNAEMARNDGCESFYFALPGQLVNGIPVDTRLR